MRDGEFFLRLLQTEVERMEGWCQTMERDAEDNELPEEGESESAEQGSGTQDAQQAIRFCKAAHAHFTLAVLERIRNAVGSAQILMSQKVQQFFRLCQQSVVSMCRQISSGLEWQLGCSNLNLQNVAQPSSQTPAESIFYLEVQLTV